MGTGNPKLEMISSRFYEIAEGQRKCADLALARRDTVRSDTYLSVAEVYDNLAEITRAAESPLLSEFIELAKIQRKCADLARIRGDESAVKKYEAIAVAYDIISSELAQYQVGTNYNSAAA